MSHSLHSDNDENLRRASLLNVCLEDSLTSNDGLGDLHILRCIIPLEENKIGLLPGVSPRCRPAIRPVRAGLIVAIVIVSRNESPPERTVLLTARSILR